MIQIVITLSSLYMEPHYFHIDKQLKKMSSKGEYMQKRHVELASETPTVDSNLEFSVVIYFEMFKDISSSDKLPRPSMSRHTEVGIWRTQIKVKYMYTITNIQLYPGWSSWK